MKKKDKILPETSDGRICYFDNIRFLLILLVVCMHCIDEVDAFPLLFKYVYTFHMPVFVFISGYFAKSKGYEKKAVGMIILYAAENTILFLMDKYCFNQEINYEFFYPKIGMWYLLAMFLWTILFPVMEQVKPVFVTAVMFFCGIMAGADKTIGSFLTLSRFLIFTPFYLLGYYARKGQFLKKIKGYRSLKVLAVIILVFYAWIINRYADVIPIKLFTAKRSFEAMGMSLMEGVGYRVLFYVSAIAVGTAFMVLIPERKFFFTKWGQNTIAVYMLHLLVVNTMVELDIVDFIEANYSAYALLLVGVVLTFVFSAGFWQKPLKAVLNGQIPVFKQQPKENSER